jgi:hypothetical protein
MGCHRLEAENQVEAFIPIDRDQIRMIARQYHLAYDTEIPPYVRHNSPTNTIPTQQAEI